MKIPVVLTGFLSLAQYSFSDRQYQYRPVPSSPLQSADSGSATNSGDSLESLSSAIPGIPALDYPIFASVPPTSFRCDSKVAGGYYADTEADCQAFHICAGNSIGGLSKYSFLCPNGTLFQQQYLICDWWYNVDCSIAQDFYSRNDEIAAEREAYGRRQVVKVTLPPTTQPPPPPPSRTPSQNIQLSGGVSIPRRSQNIQLGSSVSIPRRPSQNLQFSDNTFSSSLQNTQTSQEPVLQQQSADNLFTNDVSSTSSVTGLNNQNNNNNGGVSADRRSSSSVQSNNNPRFSTQFQVEASAPGYFYAAPSPYTRFRRIRRKAARSHFTPFKLY